MTMKLCVLVLVVWIINSSYCTVPTFENLPTTEATCATVDEDEDNNIDIFNTEAWVKSAGDEKDVDYRLNSITPPGPFEVREKDGKVKTLDKCYFDYSVTSLYVVNVCAYDDKNTADEACADLHICVVQTTFPPVMLDLPATISVSEDVTDVEMYNADSTDADSDFWRYYIESAVPASHPFMIQSADGRVKRIAPLDYETCQQYVLTIAVTDNQYIVTNDLTINILDVNEPPSFENLPSTASVYEVESAGRLVHNFLVVQEDSDAITASMTTDPTNGPFRLDMDAAGSGQIFLDFSQGVGAVDAESVASYTLTVTAADSATTITSTLVVTVVDTNESPTITNLPASFTLSEAVTTGYKLVTATVADPEGDSLKWSIASTPYSSAFQIGESSGDVTFTNNPGFDFEMTSSYTLTVYVDDGTNVGVPKEISITITDSNEPPEFTNLPTSVNLQENSKVGKTVFKVQNSDPDAGDTFTYSLSVEPSHSPAWFEITGTGLIQTTSAASLDYEAGPATFTMTVSVQDADGLSTSGVLTVNMVNKNEKPVYSKSSDAVTIPEEQPTGTVIYTVTGATDPDVGDTITYSIPSLPETRFVTLDTSTSTPKLVLSGRIDYEHPSKPHSFIIPVIATDAGSLMSILNVQVTVTDIDDNAPVFVKSSYSALLSESAGGGHQIIEVEANDADTGDNAKFEYSLTDLYSNSTLCATHLGLSSVGLVYVKNTVDAEVITDISCRLIATSPTGKVGESRLNVIITDANDNRPYFRESFYSFEAMSDATDAAFVGKIQAYDDDISETGDFDYFFATNEMNFALDSKGILKTKSPLPEYETFRLYANAEDNVTPVLMSNTLALRVDTYLGCECLLDIEVVTSPVSIMAEPAQATFLAAVLTAASMNDSTVKIVFVNGLNLLDYEEDPPSSSTTTLTLLFMKVTRSNDVVAQTKTFQKVSDVKPALSADGGTLPSAVLLYTTGLSINKVDYHSVCPTPPPVVDFWTETVGGLAALAGLGLLGAALVVTVLVLIVVGVKKLVAHLKSIQPINVKEAPLAKPEPPQLTNRNVDRDSELFDFRHNPSDNAYAFRHFSTGRI